MSEVRKRLVVYTALFGYKEPLGNPLVALTPKAKESSDLDITFVCFTDNSLLRSDVWSIRHVDGSYLPPEKLSRRPKALPHEYLADWDYSLYIDNIVTFKRLPVAADLASTKPYLFRTFRHTTRKHMGEEADTVALIGYEEVDTICRQLDFYGKLQSIDSIGPLSTATVILRSHNHPSLVRFGTLWWEQILAFSKRDQLSFDFAAIHTDCRVDHLPGFKHDNDLINNPLNTGSGRLKADFDPIRYAWLHRDEPDAVRNPKAHCLASGRETDPRYSRRIELLEYVCHKQGSSLGKYVAPRRCVVDVVNGVLTPYREFAGKMLIARIPDDLNELSFTTEEFRTAELAFATLLSRCEGLLLEKSATDFRAKRFRIDGQRFQIDIALLLSLPPDALVTLPDILFSALNPRKGLILVLCSGECDVEHIDTIRRRIAADFQSGCRVTISTSQHDSRTTPIANSVVAFEWPSPASA